MSDRADTPAPDVPEPESGRRRLLKALTVSAGAAAAAAVAPKEWIKPLLDAVVVPVNAAATTSLTIRNLQVLPPVTALPNQTLNYTARFEYTDSLGRFNKNMAALYMALTGCTGMPTYQVYPWVDMTEMNHIYVTGTPSSGVVTCPLPLPGPCAVRGAECFTQISQHDGMTDWLSNTISAPVVNGTSVW